MDSLLQPLPGGLSHTLTTPAPASSSSYLCPALPRTWWRHGPCTGVTLRLWVQIASGSSSHRSASRGFHSVPPEVPGAWTRCGSAGSSCAPRSLQPPLLQMPGLRPLGPHLGSGWLSKVPALPQVPPQPLEASADPPGLSIPQKEDAGWVLPTGGGWPMDSTSVRQMPSALCWGQRTWSFRPPVHFVSPIPFDGTRRRVLSLAIPESADSRERGGCLGAGGDRSAC